MSLLRVCEPYDDESLDGYIIRLAEANYYPDIKRFLDFIGLSKYDKNTYNLIEHRKVNLSAFSSITGIAENLLFSLTFERMNRWRHDFRRVVDNALPSYCFNTLLTKICPACLIEHNYIQIIWDLVFVNSCPKHNCLLIDTCPGCQKKIRPLRNSVSVCECGFDYRNAKITVLEPEEVQITRNIYEVCAITGKMVDEKHPRIWIDFASMITILFMTVIAKLPYQKSDWYYYDFRFLSNFELHKAFSSAYNVYLDWPNNFYDYLDDIRKNYHKGYFFMGYVISNQLNPEIFQPITQSFNEYITQALTSENYNSHK